jgi:hypothetical protein
VSLAAQIRNAVTRMASALDDVFIDVTHEAYASVNGDGKPTYATAVTRRGFLERKGMPIRWRNGLEIIGGDMLTILDNVAVDARDKFTLPDDTTPPIADWVGVADPDGGSYYVQITFGKPERGQSVT